MARKGKRLFHPIRLALTGSMSGPDIGEQLLLLEAGECFLDPRNHGGGCHVLRLYCYTEYSYRKCTVRPPNHVYTIKPTRGIETQA